MLAMEEVIPSQARLHLATENERRDWQHKVLASEHPGVLCDLILEMANAVHDSWLEPWWQPWKVIKHDTQMTLEEQQAAIASGMLEDPVKVKAAEMERKRKEEEERKKRKEAELPTPWTDQEDADLKALVCKEGIGMWLQKSALHNANGYTRTANALRHRFAQVVSAGMTAEEIDALRPEKPVSTENQGYCAACHGAHKKHICGKQKGGHLSKEAQEAEEDLAVLERARESLTTSPAPNDPTSESGEAEQKAERDKAEAEAIRAKAEEEARKRLAEAKRKADEEAAAVAAAKAKKEEEIAKAKAEAAAAKAKAEAEAKAKAEEEAAAAAAAAAAMAVEEEENRQRRSSTRGRKEPERFEAGAAPAVVGGGESSVVRKTEAERAAERLPEEIRYAPVKEEQMSATSIAMSHLWRLDSALKYQYRGNRSLRAEEELTRLREQMVEMLEAVIAVEDDTVESESEEEDTYVPRPEPVLPIEEGCRVEVIEAFGGAWVGQQGLVVSKDHGYVRCIFDGDDRGILNLRLMHLKVVPKEKEPEVIVRDTRTPQIVEYYQEKRLAHELVNWYTRNPHGYQDPKPEIDLRKRSEIFMVLPPKKDLPYYYRVIKRPIDLKIIRQRIEADKYTDMWKFKEDMELMFDNARQFNSEESLVYEDACVLNDTFNELLEKAGLGEIKDSNVSLRIGMDVEVKWRESNDWHACTIKTIGETTVDIHYAKTAQHEEFDETLLREEMTIDSVRPQSRASRMTKAKVGPGKEAAIAQAKQAGKELDILAMTVTGLPRPSRPEISSLPHEQMLKVWEAVRFIGDARGRDRGASFCRLPPRRETEYYALITNPMHLMKIRGKIEKQRYDDIDGFEIDMSTVFENARQYYEAGSRNYVDAEILQEVFWSALHVIEGGDDYSIPQEWVYSVYPFYVEEQPSPVKTLQQTAAAKARARAERDKKARQRDNFVWLKIQVDPAVTPGTICKVHDEDTRVHFVRVPPRENMVKEKDGKPVPEPDAEAAGGDDSDAAAATTQAEAEGERNTDAAKSSDGKPSAAADKGEDKGVDAEDEAAGAKSMDVDETAGDERAKDDSAMAVDEPPETPAEQAEKKRIEKETAAGILYVFKRRVPKVYSDEVFRQLDKEELEHWLTHRSVSCAWQQLHSIALHSCARAASAPLPTCALSLTPTCRGCAWMYC
jgi:hypothetical protein